MKNWLIDLAPAPRTSERSWEADPSPLPETPLLDELVEKLASAEEMGRDMAHRYPELLSKEAIAIPAPAMGLARGAAGMMMRNPKKALGIGGAIAGGAMGLMKNPGIDPQTGQTKSRLGNAALGAAGGYGLGTMAGKSQAVTSFAQGQGRNLSKMIRGAGQVPGAIPKIAEALETNDKAVDPGPLTGPGKQTAVPSKGEEKKASAFGGAAAKLLANPLARRAATGAGIGALSGGEGHHLEGAVAGGAAMAALGGGKALRGVKNLMKSTPSAVAHAPASAGKISLKPLTPQGPSPARAALAQRTEARLGASGSALSGPRPLNVSPNEHASIMHEWGVGSGPVTHSPATAADPMAKKPMRSLVNSSGPTAVAPQSAVLKQASLDIKRIIRIAA